MLIKLTNTEGKEFWLNSTQILTIGQAEHGSIIKLTNRESFFEVVEEPHDIVKMINKGKVK